MDPTNTKTTSFTKSV